MRSNYNIDKPLIWIIKRLLGADTELAAEIALAPPDEIVSAEEMAARDAEYAQAAEQSLPDDDDDDF